MDRFIDRIKNETGGEILGETEIVRIPLDLYHARNVTSRKWRALERRRASVRELRRRSLPATRPSARRISSRSHWASSARCSSPDSSASRTCRCRRRFDRYENFMYKQWLRVYMRSKMIKHNKDLFETLDDTFALLEKLHIY